MLQLGAVINLVYNEAMTVSISIGGWRPVMVRYFVANALAVPGGKPSC
jgi:hypothetical protein